MPINTSTIKYKCTNHVAFSETYARGVKPVSIHYPRALRWVTIQCFYERIDTNLFAPLFDPSENFSK